MRKISVLPLVLSLGLSLFISATANADAFVDFPGSIPINDERTGASDLVQDGRVLLPDEVLQLKRQGVDVSRINPDTSSDIWSDVSPQPLKPGSYQLGVSSTGETFQYLSNVTSLDGNFRFSVTRPDASGTVRTYTIMISKRIHNVLLRKALLEKLGYRVPQIQVLRNFNVKFNGAFSRKQFLTDINKKTFGDDERWVLNAADQNADTAVMQDAILLSGDDQIYNLALGSLLDPSVVQGRRLMNALLIPYNLTEVPESLNLFTWHPGRIINDTVYLPYEHADTLAPSIDDARWIARRVMTLSRADWTEVVAAAGYPEPVAKLAVEKLISRRNTLIKFLSLQAQEIPFNARVSSGSLLKDGKILQESWEGYGSRFAYGDPPSPLSAEEMTAFGKSKIISNVIDNLIRQFNDNLKTDISKKVYDHQLEKARERFVNFLKTGKNEKIPFGIWAAPVFSGNLIISRDLVAGAYLGTDNVIQLADTFGYALDGGIFVGFDGLPSGVGVSGTAKLGLQRTYSHIKPVKSMQAAIKEPFKNVLVPLLKKEFGHTLDPIVGELQGDETAQQNAINETVKTLKESLGIGESIIITDSLAGNAGLAASYGIADRVSVHGRISASEMVVRRLQIFRKDENTIQIYRDPATYNTLQASVGLDAVFQVMYLTVGRKAGEARTNFYSLNIQADQKENPDVVANLKALRHLLLNNSVEAVQALQKPFQIFHGFKEYTSELGIFFYRWLGLRSVDQIAVKHPEGYIKNFIYRMEGQRNGKNYEALATDVLNGLLEELTDNDNVSISPPDAVNPGDTLYGESVTRKATLEAETVRKNGREDIVENYIEVNYRYKGWKISRSGAQKLLKEISDRFGQAFYLPESLNNTKEIQLYSIDVNVSVYSAGIEYMSKISEDRMTDLFRKYGKFPKVIPGSPFACRPGDERGRICGDTMERQDYSNRQYRNKFYIAQEKYRKALSSGDAMRATEHAITMVSVAEQIFPGAAFFKVVGGEQNVFIQSRLSGFRVGDEDMENPLISNTLGQIGSEKRTGPLRFIQQNLGMTESEFFIYWLLNKI